MKIDIDRIPEAGLELQESYQPETLDLDRGDITFREPINISVAVSKGINNLVVKLTIEGTMHFNCGRCLEELSTPLFKEVVLSFLIENKQSIDITGNLREEIMLSYPLKPLCRADCCGLCSACGQDLNQGKCNCKKGEYHGSSKKTPL
ncbi:MAG: DUF177 domain-containing protein [Candidatus Omnitrophica bacterium]|nr:DUF177 domain-containing protein [Candidatus Omnitrophota bacterium]